MEENLQKLSFRVYYRYLVAVLLKYKILNEKIFKFFHPPKIESDIFYLSQIIKKNAVCIDIGANVGMYTCKLSSLVDRNGQVLAFEPSPLVFRFLRRNVNGGFKKLRNVKIFNLAIGSKQDSVSLIYSREKNGRISDPLTRIGSEWTGSMSFKMVTLDSMVKELGLQNIDFIKIDVEGYEFNVLLGAIETISRCHPVLLMEIDDVWLERYNSSSIDIIDLLKSYGYNAFILRQEKIQELNGSYQGNIYFR